MFINVEHVASPTERLHRAFLDALNVASEDPSNQLAPIETQLAWLREIGFEDVDCLWKWREMALLAGVRPSAQ
jgi:tRNA (cmo5U34)-methyltransferase